jgi:hypothetical protein
MVVSENHITTLEGQPVPVLPDEELIRELA